MAPAPAVERLVSAQYAAPWSLVLTFADGLTARLKISLLEMPINEFDWTTVSTGAAGDSMVLKSIRGEIIPVSSATLRYLTDRNYATSVDKKLASLQFTRAELEELAKDNSPPPEWRDQPTRDLTP